MTKLYMPGATLPELFEFVRCESSAVRSRRGAELWLRLPVNLGFPLYMTVLATPRLAEFMKANSIYGDEPNLDQSHYLEAFFRDDGTALIEFKYQQIIGSRWLCIVPQSQVTEWMQTHARA